MKTSLVRAALAVCLLSSASIFAVLAPTAAVAAAKPAEPTMPVVSKPVGLLLDAARKLILANDYVTAKATVLQAQAVPDRTPNDDYEINNFLGTIELKLNDHASAEIAFQAMADSPSIPVEDKPDRFRIATLLALEAKHFDRVIKYGNGFRALGVPPNDQVLAAMATAYYYTNDFTNAEAMGSQAIAAAPAGQAPNQNALEVVVSSQIKLKREADALLTLEKVVTFYDAPDDWGQLINFALGTKGIKDTEALFLYRLGITAKASNSGADYTLIANLMQQMGYPAEALAVLQDGLAAGKLENSGKSGAQIADMRNRTAKDRAAMASFDAMATKSPNGELDVKLAEAYYGYGRYADAEAAARRAIGKGGAKTDPNEANMVIGMSLVMEGKNADAITAFNNVKGGNAAMAKAQHLWLLYANRKYTAPAATH